MIFVSLLRGINVSGQKKIKMTDLKALYEGLGLTRVITYIQSGNVLFASKEKAVDMKNKIETAIKKQYRFDVSVLVIPAEELRLIALANPFSPDADVSSLYLTLLEKLPDEELVERIQSDASSDDEFQLIDRAIYLNCTKGYGRTKLNNAFFESKLKLKATTRNWKTVLKVIELTQQVEQYN